VLESGAPAAETFHPNANGGKEELDVEHRANLRELTPQAHGVNLDLGTALLNDLAMVAPDDIDVARFFALCGHPHRANYAARATMPTRWSCRARVGGPLGLVELGGCRHSFGARRASAEGRSLCSDWRHDHVRNSKEPGAP
jgi:hypothetical protein